MGVAAHGSQARGCLQAWSDVQELRGDASDFLGVTRHREPSANEPGGVKHSTEFNGCLQLHPYACFGQFGSQSLGSRRCRRSVLFEYRLPEADLACSRPGHRI